MVQPTRSRCARRCSTCTARYYIVPNRHLACASHLHNDRKDIINNQGSHQTRPLIVMVLESHYPTYRGQENQITERTVKLSSWSRQNNTPRTSLKRMSWCSCADWRPRSSPLASQHGKNRTPKSVNNCAVESLKQQTKTSRRRINYFGGLRGWG